MWWVWWLLFWIFSISGGVCWLWHYLGGDRKYWPSRGIYFLEYSKIISLFDQITFKHQFTELEKLVYNEFKRSRHRFGGVIELRKPGLFIMDLELVKNIMVKDFDYFVNRPELFDLGKTDPLFHKMLTLLKDQEWKDMRSTMSPTFTTGKIRRMYEIFDSSSNKMANFFRKKIRSGETELEVRQIFTRYTLDVISSAAFGLESHNFDEVESEFCKMVKRIQSVTVLRIIKFFFMFLFPKFFAALRIPLTDTKSSEFFAEVTRKAIKHREETGEIRDDFLHLLIEAKNHHLKDDERDADELHLPKSNKIQLNESHILSQSLLFFFAGFDTIETFLIFASYELAIHPEIQDKLYNELRQGFEANSSKLNFDVIMKMEYLDKIVSEVLRKYPPGVRTERISSRPYQIPNSDVVLEKGTRVIVPAFAIHYDEQYYPDPDKFDPERFSVEAKASRNAYAYMPFGVGPRNCIAMRFALAEGKAAIAHLILNFKLEPVAKTPIPMKFSKTQGIKPDGGNLYLSIKPR